VSLNHSIQITLLFIQEVDQNLPRTLNHLKLTISLHLTDEVYHLGHDDPNLMPV
jgi:hypothetical protein